MGFTKDDIKRVVWTFAQAFLAVLVAGLLATSQYPNDWNGWKAFGASLVVGALAAGLSAVKNFFVPTESALK